MPTECAAQAIRKWCTCAVWSAQGREPHSTAATGTPAPHNDVPRQRSTPTSYTQLSHSRRHSDLHSRRHSDLHSITDAVGSRP